MRKNRKTIMLINEKLIVDITASTVIKTLIDGMQLADKDCITLKELEILLERCDKRTLE
jgi:hypothetical protein